MSIEALPATSTINESLESVEEQENQFPTEAEVIANLLQLQGRKETLFTGLTALATQMNLAPADRLQSTCVAMAEEYCEYFGIIKELKKDHPDIVIIQAPENTEERRVRLHNELTSYINLLHELQTCHATLTMGLLALAEVSHASSSTTVMHNEPSTPNERNKLADLIAVLREEQGVILTTISACNQTVTRPRPNDPDDPNFEADKAERRRIEQPYVIQIHNNGEDPTNNDNLPEHLTGLNYRYLTNTAL